MTFNGANARAVAFLQMANRLNVRRWFQGTPKPIPNLMPLKRPALTEEEMFRKYAIPGHYHPVGVGDTFKERRYVVTRKPESIRPFGYVWINSRSPRLPN
jgi:hypothetical protein